MMVKRSKILKKVLSGSKNIRFGEFVALLEDFGFVLRDTKGNHQVFRHPKMPRPFPTQPRHDGKAKPYQIRQLVKFIQEYDLRLDDREDK